MNDTTTPQSLNLSSGFDFIAVLRSTDLRLGDLFPSILVPLVAYPSLIAGFSTLLIAIYTLTAQNPTSWLPLRLFLAPISIYFFWHFGYAPYQTPANQVAVGLAVVGLYGIMRVLETTFVGMIDTEVPQWVRGGRLVAVPETMKERILYSLDLATSLRGNSWLPETHWNWAPRALATGNSPTSHMSKSQFLKASFMFFIQQYIILDILDTLNKSRKWDTSILNPITSLSLLEQLVFSISVCAGTLLAITMTYTLISTICVSFGSSPNSWPPMFDHPFAATSLADFWTKRWHAIFRRVFDRISTGILYFLPLPQYSHDATTPKQRRLIKAVRAVVIFLLSAFMHIMIMYRLGRRNTWHPQTFFDYSIFKFFLTQPLGLMIEALIIIPLSNFIFTGKQEKWKAVVTRVWAWCFLLWAGRFWGDVWVYRGLWNDTEKVVGYSVLRGLLYGKWAI